MQLVLRGKRPPELPRLPPHKDTEDSPLWIGSSLSPETVCRGLSLGLRNLQNWEKQQPDQTKMHSHTEKYRVVRWLCV